MIYFRPMSASEFNQFKKNSILSFAKEWGKNQGVSKTRALAEARGSFKKHLTKGMRTPGHFFYKIMLGEKVLGHLWYGLRDDGLKSGPLAYLYDIALLPRYQGQGHGKTVMKLWEKEVRQQKIKVLGLHVFGHNIRAQKLYAKMGFMNKNIVMTKELKTLK